MLIGYHKTIDAREAIAEQIEGGTDRRGLETIVSDRGVTDQEQGRGMIGTDRGNCSRPISAKSPIIPLITREADESGVLIYRITRVKINALNEKTPASK